VLRDQTHGVPLFKGWIAELLFGMRKLAIGVKGAGPAIGDAFAHF